MSSTGRGTTKISQDAYFTPLKSFNPLLPYLPKGKEIWEPACGDLRLVKRMNEYGLKSNGNDLSYGYDFLKDKTKRDVILTNPPFSIAKAFITHALDLSEEVYMLVRLNFLGSQERREWWRKNPPNALFILSERPNFVRSIKCQNKKHCGFKQLIPIELPKPKCCPNCNGKITSGSSDSTEYCWMYWGSEHTGIYWL